MIVATFGPSTARAGRTITFEDERFFLEGHGQIPAAGVVGYDDQKLLVWPTNGMRAWVNARAQWEAEAGRPTPSSPGQTAEPDDLLLPAGDIQDVVGESHYQAELEAIVGGKSEAACEVEKWAHLVPEPENPYDRNAVAVYIEGRKVAICRARMQMTTPSCSARCGATTTVAASAARGSRAVGVASTSRRTARHGWTKAASA